MTHKYANKFYLDSSDREVGVVARWESNNQIPFADMLQEFMNEGLIGLAVYENSNAQRKAETTAFLHNYRMNYKGPSEEDRVEARAAFGPGVELTNVITGHSWTT